MPRVQMAIYMSDGAANLDVDKTVPNAIDVHNADILVIAVSVGFDANTALLSAIVTRPPERHLFVLLSADDLEGAVDDVVDATCNSENDCLPQPCQNAGQCVDKVRGTARRTYRRTYSRARTPASASTRYVAQRDGRTDRPTDRQTDGQTYSRARTPVSTSTGYDS